MWGNRRRAVVEPSPVVADEGAPSAGRRAADGGLLATSAVMLTVARLIRLAATIVFLLIALAILLRVLDANATNSIVSDVHDAGKWLAGPFDGIFSLDSAKATLAVNWGLAAVVYMIVGSIIASLISAPARGARASVGIRRRRV